MKIAAGEFKTKRLKLMGNVQKYHKDTIITKDGKPTAQLTAVEEEIPKPLFGFLKNSVVITEDIVKLIGDKWSRLP
ncbi:MAG: type II toxin-antitoxin system prevent-host-death family antitoxin [Candidatus Scalindua sp. AMX11]|nr:MAG: type II toxin-antitoxin system prevent-host-death family antitoxin [Candidatus Scalindua sp.]NOG84237.1 type II toxin-antitoxin system prevent-host-death family antitoxin [Planctomycetota bacterium]RZV61458.1 MAG: type II toxin-antitoxin system prevent-host-death family antitoxin [Candidatus Scalindua sp. SCAELEC01]TDE63208.1 MAG: type II toxin-antitoxin system prevent-host-death family antitoxin [Candidatus Scalindua sp. AMX11]GJQ57540.1 MAG: hypothetical protein SCALA701_03410 [Candid